MKIDKGRIINDFIEPNKRQYAIPVYQRNYEWSKEQCVKLFEDIVQAYKKDRTHFCGSVVYAPLKEEQNIHYYIIIDGQQRLTTIYLLLKALIDLAENDATRELIAETLFNRDKFDKFAIDKASKLKLKPNLMSLFIPIRNMTVHRKNMSPELQSCAVGEIPSSCFILIIIHIRRYLIRIILW